MRHIALLRGINVGRNNIIKMADLSNKKMKIFFISTFVILGFISHGQDVIKIYEPSSYYTPDLSVKSKNEIERQTELLSKVDLTPTEKVELDTLIQKYGEVVESIWNIIDGGCSWYCGGGNYKVSASSELTSKNHNNYQAKSANDLSYLTAWVEGKEGSGIGEYIEYSFKNNSPRITSIIISNGYMKSENTWKNNNRVKSLKLYVNGKVFGILNLTDSMTDQTFKLGTFGKNADGSDLVLRFEILTVYKGDKYDDTAITEIYFDGIDVH